jgi:hypothetical protein
MRKKLGFLAAALALSAATFASPHTAQAACHMWTDYFTYYSDASKTVQVGWCEYDCYCISYCEGQKTPYYRLTTWPGCL